MSCTQLAPKWNGLQAFPTTSKEKENISTHHPSGYCNIDLVYCQSALHVKPISTAEEDFLYSPKHSWFHLLSAFLKLPTVWARYLTLNCRRVPGRRIARLWKMSRCLLPLSFFHLVFIRWRYLARRIASLRLRPFLRQRSNRKRLMLARHILVWHQSESSSLCLIRPQGTLRRNTIGYEFNGSISHAFSTRLLKLRCQIGKHSS